MIIDDSFSGLDADTEEVIFARLLGKKGLLRQMKTTVVLVTHAVHRLPFASHIVALDINGHITEQGTFDHLLNSSGYVAGLTTKHKYDDKSAPDGDLHVDQASEEQKTADIGRTSSEMNDSVRPNGEFSTYKYYFASMGWSQSLLSLSIFIVAGVSVKMTELLLKYWTGAVALHGNGVNAIYLGVFGLLTGIATLAFNIGVYHYFLYLVPRSAETLHAKLLTAVMQAPLHFFTITDTGTTTNR
jgi:ATP-binding cassette subfamily C (CFTR/MRP) protein 1